jgi:transcriptional regulator with GAF, ATPase, and Fis domain
MTQEEWYPKNRSAERMTAFDNASPTSLRERLEFETLLADMSTKFVNLPAGKIDQEIEHVLQRIAEVLEIDRCSVAQFSDNRKKLRVTHAFAVPGVTPMPDLTLNETQPWYSEKLFRCEAIVMSSLDQLPAEAAVEKAYCRLQGIKSSVLIPLAVGGSFLGVVGFAALKTEREWPEVLVQRLNLLGVVFANALMRKQAEQKLHQAFNEIQDLKDRLEAENTYLREEISLQYSHEEFIGQSDTVKNVLKQAEQVAAMDTTVLILGETGTGKELLAQAIHKLSRRKERPMVTVNCAALPSNLIESELFGHERGAYTGAEFKRIGRFELANGSSLFLDEIGELSLSLQAKLLRVLQEKQFERLGGHETLSCDVRVIAATNRDLLQAVRMGEFRMDLYYRLNVFPIVIPPLRDRRADIQPLVWFFVRSFCEKMGKRINTIPRTSMHALCDYHWPGNVRELKNLIERALIITSGETLRIDLPGNQGALNRETRTLNAVQKEYILSILELTQWRIRGNNGAAEILGLKPTTLESKMAKIGIHRPQNRFLG